MQKGRLPMAGGVDRKELNYKLISIGTLVSLVMLLVGGISYYAGLQGLEQNHHLTTVLWERSLLSNDMLSSLQKLRLSIRTAMMPEATSVEATEAMDQYVDAVKTFEANLHKFIDTRYSKEQIFALGEEEIYRDVESNWKKYLEIAAREATLVRFGGKVNYEKTLELLRREDPGSALPLTQAIVRLIEFQSEEAKRREIAAQSSTNQKDLVLFLVLFASLSAIQGMIYFFSKRLERTLLKLEAEGDRKVDEFIDVMGEFEEKSRQIKELVFQAKLLTFNASVEAARAGEHGKRFFSVAEEVRKLAAKSGQTANDFRMMLGRSTEALQNVLSRTRQK